MMVAAVVGGREVALAIDRAAELAAPDHQRVVQQAALLEVLDQRGRGLVGVAALAANLLGQRGVLVPAHVEELDEAHAALGQPPGQQAVGGKRARLARRRGRTSRTRRPARCETSVSSGTEVCMR